MTAMTNTPPSNQTAKAALKMGPGGSSLCHHGLYILASCHGSPR